MANRGADDYTCDDARTFDPVLRLQAPAIAQFLFDKAMPGLLPGSSFENVEFETVCSKNGSHGPNCQIQFVTIRRRSDGPNGNDVFNAFPELVSEERMASIRRVHNQAYAP